MRAGVGHFAVKNAASAVQAEKAGKGGGGVMLVRSQQQHQHYY